MPKRKQRRNPDKSAKSLYDAWHIMLTLTIPWALWSIVMFFIFPLGGEKTLLGGLVLATTALWAMLSFLFLNVAALVYPLLILATIRWLIHNSVHSLRRATQSFNGNAQERRDDRAIRERLANEQPIVGDDGELIFRSERQQKR